MRALSAKALVLSMAACLGTPAVAEPFDGLYRPDTPEAESWDCKTVGVDGGALAIEGDVLKGVESQCKLTNPVAVTGMDAILYDAECAGEGETYSYRVMIMRLAEGLALIEDGYVNQLKACK